MSSALRTAVAPALRALPFHPPTTSSSSLSTLALRALQSGSLVPDALILSLTSHRLSQPDCRSNGWVLDGLPRTPAQAASLLSAEQTRPDAVLHLRVPADVIRDRLVHRRRDPVTGATYNLKTAPPATPQVHQRLEARPDDAPHVVEKRLQTYDRVMPRVWHVFEAHGVPVVQVDVAAEENVHDVQQRVMDQVDGWQKVVVAGPPGCGKGTHGLRLADELDGVHVSTGDLLRKVAEMAREEEEERVVGLVAMAAQLRQQGRRAAA